MEGSSVYGGQAGADECHEKETIGGGRVQRHQDWLKP